jgi:peptidyl-prolyl cis-trans isomerase SurA
MGSIMLIQATKIGGAAAAAALLALTFGLASPAAAQQVVARVNGEPITAMDLQQRTKLHLISGNKTANRKEMLDELIDEQLKLQIARRYRIDIADSEVDQVVANMALRMRASASQFAHALGTAGVSVNALKRKLRADLAWQNIVRGKFQASLQLRDKDIVAAVESRGKGGKDAVTYDYLLRPILLVVPRGAPVNTIEGRRREAEGLRTRFQNCDDGLRLARGLKDVAVREPIRRSSGDFTGKLREVIDSIQVGHLTPPDLTPSGIEVFAVCEKNVGKGSSGAERDVREELYGERFQAQGKEYLQQLRRSAAIEIK